jgi:hypothetical protein
VSDIFITSRSAGVAVDWLCLAATPTFAIMALLAGLSGGQPDILCASMHHASAFNGMVLMYLLMSAFHAAPWLKLISSYKGISSVLGGTAGAVGTTGAGGGWTTTAAAGGAVGGASVGDAAAGT